LFEKRNQCSRRGHAPKRRRSQRRCSESRIGHPVEFVLPECQESSGSSAGPMQACLRERGPGAIVAHPFEVARRHRTHSLLEISDCRRDGHLQRYDSIRGSNEPSYLRNTLKNSSYAIVSNSFLRRRNEPIFQRDVPLLAPQVAGLLGPMSVVSALAPPSKRGHCSRHQASVALWLGSSSFGDGPSNIAAVSPASSDS